MDEKIWAVIRTVALYDLHGRVLTVGECARWVRGVSVTEKDVEKIAETEKVLKLADGCVFWRESGRTKKERDEKLKNSVAAMKKAKKILKILRFCPGVRGVYASGSFSLGAMDENSDLDIFLVTLPWRVWTVRFFAWVLLRARWGSGRGQVCVNHFVGSLDLKPKNVYTARLYSHFSPIFDDGSFAEMKKQNKWIEKYGRPAWDDVGDGFEVISPIWSPFWVEKVLEWVQKVYFRVRGGRVGEGVYFLRDELRFHPDPQEPRVLAELARRESGSQ